MEHHRLPLEDLETLTLTSIIRESISLPRSSPRTFSLLTLTLIFPLSFAILAHTLFTHPILHHLHSSPSSTHPHQWLLLFLYQFLYLLFLLTFSLLSTAALVFTVASVYASKPLSFAASFAAIPPVFSRLFRTFLCFSTVLIAYNLAFAAALLLLLLVASNTLAFAFFAPVVILAFLAVHVYISAVWHLASVVTVLEPMCGFAAMRKSRELLQGKLRLAVGFVAGYFVACGAISGVFRLVVVRDGTEFGVGTKVLVGGVLVAVLVVVNLVGLLVQSVFYYVCKSFHHQVIDKSALYEHLGGYLGEYVPLKSSIQMEDI